MGLGLGLGTEYSGGLAAKKFTGTKLLLSVMTAVNDHAH
jgi:hypothetical protein